MRPSYIQYGSPQFRILSDKQIEELHFATLQILERTGVAFKCQEAIHILGDAGADVSNPKRVKIPGHLVEAAIRKAPKMVTLYTREGEPAFVLNGMTGSHFGVQPDSMNYLDPHTRKSRAFQVQDIIDHIRIADALPNIEWFFTCPGYAALPGDLAERVSVLQCILNSPKPIVAENVTVAGLRDAISLCEIVAGGEDCLRQKPFLVGSSEPVSPLIQGEEAMEKSLVCAEKGIPNVVYSMPMLGATVPATFAGCLAIANAEALSQLVVLQLKNPGTPVICGSLPSVMDMKTSIFSFGAPEMSLMVGALTELFHHYRIPAFGTAGCTDAEVIGVQAGSEITYQIMTSALTGADLVHDVGIMYHDKMVSPELTVLTNEVIDMVRVLMGGIEINEETLALDLIDRLGPENSYITEDHTFNHFRKFWSPKIFDRSAEKEPGTNDAEDLLNQRTIEILKDHQPKPLSEDLVRELNSVEKSWFDSKGLKHEYPQVI